METTILGRTGLEVSRLGVGLAQIGQYSLDEPEQAGRVLSAALDAGINFLDTAECYGNSEELIGETVGHRRNEFIIATKAGHVSGDYKGQPWTARTVTDGIERSLVRMKTDHVELVQIHAYDIPAPPPDEVLKAVLDARDAGKTRFVGYSGENEDAEWALESGHFDTLQTAFNLVDQRARQVLFERARSDGVGIIAKRPIANAAWGKAATAEAEGLAGTMAERARRARAMMELGPLRGAPEDPIALALGFVLAHDEVGTAIVGTANPEHMLANIEAIDRHLPISEEVVAELQSRFDRVGGDWPGID